MLLLSTFPPFHGHHESPWRRNKSQSAIHNKLRKRHGKGGTKILRPFQSIATSGRPILHQSPILIYRQGPLPPPPSYPGETLPPSQGCSGSRDLNSHRLFRRLNRVRACHAFGLSQFKPIGFMSRTNWLSLHPSVCSAEWVRNISKKGASRPWLVDYKCDDDYLDWCKLIFVIVIISIISDVFNIMGNCNDL